MKTMTEKRKFGKVSYPQDQLDKVKQIIAYRLTGASSVSAYFLTYMESHIRNDWMRLQSHLFDVEQKRKEEEEFE